MSKLNIIRAWKDPLYRSTLSAAQKALVPEHPAGLVELTDEDLGVVAGGIMATTHSTVTQNDICCCSGCACIMG